MKKLYAGIDLHSNNIFLGIIDHNDQRVHKKRLPNMQDVLYCDVGRALVL